MSIQNYLIRRNQTEAGIVLCPDVERVLVCYRLWYWADTEYEAVWALVQRHGGYLRIGPDHCDYWITRDYESLIVLAFEELVRQPNLDYV